MTSLQTDDLVDPPARLLVAFDTRRLHLRPISHRDETLYCRLYTDPQLMRHIATPMTKDAALKSFRLACKQQSPARQRWIVCQRDVAEGFGLVGLFADASDGGTAEVGVMLLADAQGAGLGTEAMAGVIDLAFETMSLRLIWIRQGADNTAVPPMMRKLGFEPMPSPRVGANERYWQQDRSQWQAARGTTPAFEKPG
jgi:RimJ/RimL family protein N-acetyltransferase